MSQPGVEPVSAHAIAAGPNNGSLCPVELVETTFDDIRSADLAIGSDTGGSVRIPASLNGVVGYKGSSTTFPKSSVFLLSETLDTLGPNAADVPSYFGAAEILNGCSPASIKPKPASSLKFLIPENVVFDGVQDAVIQNFEACIRILEGAGARINRGHLGELDEICDLAKHGYLVGPEALDLYWERVHPDDAANFDPGILERIRTAGAMSARDLVVLQRARTRLIGQNRQSIGDQIILFPTTPIVAPEPSPLEQDDELYVRINGLMLRNTSLGNFLDWCGVALPSGTDQNQMPTSILMSMPGGREQDLLASALTVESALTRTIKNRP